MDTPDRRAAIGSREQAVLNLRASERPGKWEAIRHSFTPKDPDLREKAGFEKGERIHFFSAFAGGWAHALAGHGLEVHATDISREIVNRLRADWGNLRSVRQAEAGYGAIVPEHYDWSVSYEPFQAFLTTNGVENAARLALINRKGMKIFYGDPASLALHLIRMKSIATTYGAELIKEKIVLRGSGKSGPENRIVTVLTLITNPKARKIAELDLYVERRLNSSRDVTEKLAGKLADEFKVDKKEIMSSMERIRRTQFIGLQGIIDSGRRGRPSGPASIS